MYLLDANAFMEASRLYYAFDIAPGFWEWLGSSSLTGQVGSIDVVKDEVTAGTGDLVSWAASLPASFWAVGEFMASADLKLIAHGMAIDATVVTREQPAPESKKKIKIPDVCNAFHVSWADPFSAYRTLGLRLLS